MDIFIANNVNSYRFRYTVIPMIQIINAESLRALSGKSADNTNGFQMDWYWKRWASLMMLCNKLDLLVIFVLFF